MPTKPAYGVYFSQLVRIDYEDFRLLMFTASKGIKLMLSVLYFMHSYPVAIVSMCLHAIILHEP